MTIVPRTKESDQAIKGHKRTQKNDYRPNNNLLRGHQQKLEAKVEMKTISGKIHETNLNKKI